MPDAFLPYTWVKQMEWMLAEQCVRRRYKSPYHLRKDETISFEKAREKQDISKFLFTSYY